MPGKVRVVVGLGNPGEEYASTRHNAGFFVCDRLASRAGVSFSRAPYPAQVARLRIKNVVLHLVKPMTYMNLCGQVVGSLRAEWPDLPEILMIVLDDADLPLGKLRIRPAGSSGGHRGLGSMIDALGTDRVARLRIGVGRSRSDLKEHVLAPFTRDELPVVTAAVERAADAATRWALEGIERCMNEFNREPPETETCGPGP